MEPITSSIRRAVAASFNDEEFSAFVFDYFPEVYNNFASGNTLPQKIQMLLEHCNRNHLLHQITRQLSEIRPMIWERLKSEWYELLKSQCASSNIHLYAHNVSDDEVDSVISFCEELTEFVHDPRISEIHAVAICAKANTRYRTKENRNKAIQLFAKVETLTENNEVLRRALQWKVMSRYETEEQIQLQDIQDLRKAVSLKPDDWEAHNMLARFCFLSANAILKSKREIDETIRVLLEESIEAYTMALDKLGDGDAGGALKGRDYLLRDRSYSYANLGMFERAIVDLDRAIEINPYWLSRRATLYFALAMRDSAMDIKLDPTNNRYLTQIFYSLPEWMRNRDFPELGIFV